MKFFCLLGFNQHSQSSTCLVFLESSTHIKCGKKIHDHLFAHTKACARQLQADLHVHSLQNKTTCEFLVQNKSIVDELARINCTVKHDFLPSVNYSHSYENPHSSSLQDHNSNFQGNFGSSSFFDGGVCGHGNDGRFVSLQCQICLKY